MPACHRSRSESPRSLIPVIACHTPDDEAVVLAALAYRPRRGEQLLRGRGQRPREVQARAPCRRRDRDPSRRCRPRCAARRRRPARGHGGSRTSRNCRRARHHLVELARIGAGRGCRAPSPPPPPRCARRQAAGAPPSPSRRCRLLAPGSTPSQRPRPHRRGFAEGGGGARAITVIAPSRAFTAPPETGASRNSSCRSRAFSASARAASGPHSGGTDDDGAGRQAFRRADLAEQRGLVCWAFDDEHHQRSASSPCGSRPRWPRPCRRPRRIPPAPPSPCRSRSPRGPRAAGSAPRPCPCCRENR